uniref:Ephrin RBD domain-containing protein n=1 Tax=Ciona savignyi TaxID=51511 RepID=H2Y9E1_CIOSA
MFGYKNVLFLYWLSFAKLVMSRTNHVVYWDRKINTSLTTELRVHVKINEWMDILCPRKIRHSHKTRDEELYIELYNITADQYPHCAAKAIQRVLTCSNPRRETKLTTKFQVRSPSPIGFVFQPGQTYYYISKPSKGQTSGCTSDTLRLVVEVAPANGPKDDKAEHHHSDPWLDNSELEHHQNTRHHHAKSKHEHLSKDQPAGHVKTPKVLLQQAPANTASPGGGNSAHRLHTRRTELHTLAAIASLLYAAMFAKWV